MGSTVVEGELIFIHASAYIRITSDNLSSIKSWSRAPVYLLLPFHIIRIYVSAFLICTSTTALLASKAAIKLGSKGVRLVSAPVLPSYKRGADPYAFENWSWFNWVAKLFLEITVDLQRWQSRFLKLNPCSAAPLTTAPSVVELWKISPVTYILS